MEHLSELLRAIASLAWVVLAAVAVVFAYRLLKQNNSSLRKLGVGPAGITMEFAEQKLDEAARAAESSMKKPLTPTAKRSVLHRLEYHSSELQQASILWVDDHPESNAPIIELLRHYGATVDTPRSNVSALALLEARQYDVVMSDVARDTAEEGDLAGLTLTSEVFDRWGLRSIIFTSRFDPVTLPGYSMQERLAVVAELQRSAFAVTRHTDEALHLVLDVLERTSGAVRRAHGLV